MSARLPYSRSLALLLALLLWTVCRPAEAYSVLSHEEVVDMAWTPQIVPMLKARYPGISDDEIRQAHAYAYGGSVIQDIGYYPFGSKYFSDLLHYVRTGDFVAALIRDSRTPDEYAFALGALAHYCGDEIGHPYVNLVTAMENPRMSDRYGNVVTYAENPTAHVRTEFGFDVVQVAHGKYSQQNYRDFVGFQVAKPLLDQAFEETYGMKVSKVIPLEDLSIASYRHAVSGLVPEMTKLAYENYKDQIQQAAPGVSKRTFEYRLDRTEYAREFGTDYTHVGFGARVFAALLKILPKVGPLKALKVTIPNPKEQDMYLKSVNETVDRFRMYLAQVTAAPAPLPPPDPKDAEAAEKAAAKLGKDAKKAEKTAAKAADPSDQAMKAQVAANVQAASAKASAAADRTAAKVEAVKDGAALPVAAGAVTPGTPIEAPTTPKLAEVNLDTGKPAARGEYGLADKTWAKLLDDLVKGSKGAVVDAALAGDIEQFFAHTVPHTGGPRSAKGLAKEAAISKQVDVDLVALKAMVPAGGAVAVAGVQ